MLDDMMKATTQRSWKIPKAFGAVAMAIIGLVMISSGGASEVVVSIFLFLNVFLLLGSLVWS